MRVDEAYADGAVMLPVDQLLLKMLLHCQTLTTNHNCRCIGCSAAAAGKIHRFVISEYEHTSAVGQ